MRYQGKAWDRHFLSRLTSLDIQELPKEETLLVLMIGAVEQSGPHLPIYTDMLIGEAYLENAFAKLPEDAPIWMLPPLPYGKSSEHIGFAGTMTLSTQAFTLVLMDIARSVVESGFKKLLLFNVHGGNSDLLNVLARDIRIKEGLEVYRLDASTIGLGRVGVDETEQQVGIHGGDVPTSFILAVKPEWVQKEHVISEIPNLPSGEVFSFRNRSFAWVMKDITDSGVCGDATISNGSKGELMIEYGGKLLAEAMLEMASFKMASLKQR